MEDTTNKNNIKMIVMSILIFFSCIIIVFALSIVFGMRTFSTVSNFYDRPAASISFHDHRL